MKGRCSILFGLHATHAEICIFNSIEPMLKKEGKTWKAIKIINKKNSVMKWITCLHVYRSVKQIN